MSAAAEEFEPLLTLKEAAEKSRLRASGMNLVHLKCLFRRGQVVKADMTIRKGVRCGLWFVEGGDCDDKQVRATLAVRSQEMSVEIVEVGRRDEQHAKTTAA